LKRVRPFLPVFGFSLLQTNFPSKHPLKK